MEDENDREEPPVTSIEDYKSEEQKKYEERPFLTRLEDRAIAYLYSLIERPAESPRFWIMTTLGMVAALVGPMILISLFFLGRDLGYFE
jgi:hypothetical protein